ncbi:hypothetical protein L1887_52910 [Cichorium endivia]|nr:hypothetical protein L1887_52910 [Cichorium endivia]
MNSACPKGRQKLRLTLASGHCPLDNAFALKLLGSLAVLRTRFGVKQLVNDYNLVITSQLWTILHRAAFNPFLLQIANRNLLEIICRFCLPTLKFRAASKLMRTFVENSSDDFLMTIEAFQILKGLQIETPNERPI